MNPPSVNCGKASSRPEDYGTTGCQAYDAGQALFGCEESLVTRLADSFAGTAPVQGSDQKSSNKIVLRELWDYMP